MVHRQHLLNRISDLNRNILNMGIYVADAMKKSVKALVENNIDMAKEVIKEDDRINSLELSIQDDLTVLIATEQPVASDLRHVITSIKVITQLERMGDHAVHIAKETLRLGNTEYIKPLIDIPKMSEIGLKMLQLALDAFASLDVKKAREAAAMDDQVDSLRSQVNRELLTYMMEDIKNLKQINSFMFIARFLERFADHVTNICEWIVYDSNGEHVELNL